MLRPKSSSIEQPEINVLIADTFLNNCKIGTVLRPRDFQAALAQRQIIARMKWYCRFNPENNGAATNGWEIVCLISNRSDADIGRLRREKAVQIRRFARDVMDARKYGKTQWIKNNPQKQQGRKNRGHQHE